MSHLLKGGDGRSLQNLKKMEEKSQQDGNVRLPQIERGDKKLDNTLKERTYS
jgi:hypothetical protein